MLGSRLTMDKFRLRWKLGRSTLIAFFTSTNDLLWLNTNFPWIILVWSNGRVRCADIAKVLKGVKCRYGLRRGMYNINAVRRRLPRGFRVLLRLLPKVRKLTLNAFIIALIRPYRNDFLRFYKTIYTRRQIGRTCYANLTDIQEFSQLSSWLCITDEFKYGKSRL